MPQFRPGEPITTEEPVVTVEVSEDSPLSVGAHVFQLIVEDDSGNRSQPAQVQVVVIDDQAPTAILRATPQRVPFGSNLQLDGRQSTDIGGRIVSFEWMLVD